MGVTPRKDAPQSGMLHMGSNSMACFEAGVRQWQVILKGVTVGLATIPGGPGGVLCGSEPGKAFIHHYTHDGLLIGKAMHDPKIVGAKPDQPNGMLDYYGAISVQRDPRDGILDLFVEDNFNLRIVWYRIDGRGRQTDGPVRRWRGAVAGCADTGVPPCSRDAGKPAPPPSRGAAAPDPAWEGISWRTVLGGVFRKGLGTSIRSGGTDWK